MRCTQRAMVDFRLYISLMLLTIDDNGSSLCPFNHGWYPSRSDIRSLRSEYSTTELWEQQ